VIPRALINTPTACTRMQREIAHLKQLDHPFITEFFEVIETETNVIVAMEYAENGDLLNYIHRNGPLPEAQARWCFAQLVATLEYLHVERRIAHRDLKMENILLDRYKNIRLADFGLSKEFSPDSPQLKSTCGSPPYAAPEMVKGEPYSHEADIWSSGVLLFAIVVGRLPFWNDNTERLFNETLNEPVRYPSFLSPPLVDLLDKLLCKNPRQRITLQGIKSHAWFAHTDCLALVEEVLPKAKANGRRSISIDRDVIDRIIALGIDCRDLPHALVANEFTDLTALYRMYIREKTTEGMQETFQKVAGAGTAPLVRPQRPGTRTLPATTIVLPFAGSPTLVIPVSTTAKGDGRRRTARPIVLACRGAMPCARPAAPRDG
jgi:serine/threonine protein kinase